MKNPKKKSFPAQKTNLHPRNLHRERYDFPALCETSPELKAFVARNQWGDDSIDFADPLAVKALNSALLQHFYQIGHWDIPDGYLCPPIPGRADYLHYLADVLASDNGYQVPRGPNVCILDIGVGANCIYPLIGQHEYGWRFTGTEIDPVALKSAGAVIKANPEAAKNIRLRQQQDPAKILKGAIKAGEHYAATQCNPPFHSSAEEALNGTRRKLTNLGRDASKPVLNFGGKAGELWCEGGEVAFITKMIEESESYAKQVGWFTSLVSRQENLPAIYEALEDVEALDVRTVEMSQGQKVSRFVAWTFLPENKRKIR